MATTLWLLDRSRYETGLDRCLMARFLNYHFGPSGYGIALKAQSIPLAVGGRYHDGLAEILAWVRDHDQLPPDPIIRAACASATAEYLRLVKQRSLAVQAVDQDRIEEIAQEQCCLIEGLLWAFCLTTLPWLLEHSRVIHVEVEVVYVLGCTCGLGEGIGGIADHEARDCQGIGLQSRPDFLTEYRARPRVFAYWEFKGAGYSGRAEDWQTKLQFAASALGAQVLLEAPIAETYVIELLKGKREGRDYDPVTKGKTGPLIQNSTLCYWYRRPGNPPLDEPDWQEQYEWLGEDGKNHRLGRDYKKVGIWELVQDVPELQAATFTASEYLCKSMHQAGRLGRHVNVIGPMTINQTMVGHVMAEMVGHESRWMDILWELHEILEGEAEGDWTHPAYQEGLRRLIPRSWACRRFGGRYGGQFERICFEQVGWEQPLESGYYIPRRPHHEPERKQLEARGLVPEAGWEEEGDPNG